MQGVPSWEIIPYSLLICLNTLILCSLQFNNGCTFSFPAEFSCSISPSKMCHTFDLLLIRPPCVHVHSISPFLCKGKWVNLKGGGTPWYANGTIVFLNLLERQPSECSLVRILITDRLVDARLRSAGQLSWNSTAHRCTPPLPRWNTHPAADP